MIFSGGWYFIIWYGKVHKTGQLEIDANSNSSIALNETLNTEDDVDLHRENKFDLADLKYYMLACFWMCWGSCTPNLHALLEIVKGNINFFDDVITQSFIIINNLNTIFTTMDMLRTGYVYVPPLLR